MLDPYSEHLGIFYKTMIDTEKWLPIKNFEDRYRISSFGNVYSLRSGRKIIPQLQKSGYLNVKIDGRTYNIHRMVAEHFIQNPNIYPCINHKDGDKQNNHVDNLEWCTYSENLIHAYRNGLNKCERPVERLLNGVVIKRYRSAREAEKDGFANQLIAKCCNGKRKHHKGYEWKYEERN